MSMPTVTFLAAACGRSWARLPSRIERAKVLHRGIREVAPQGLRWPGRERRHRLVAVGLKGLPARAKERPVG
jgi:hypothetical protein